MGRRDSKEEKERESGGQGEKKEGKRKREGGKGGGL